MNGKRAKQLRKMASKTTVNMGGDNYRPFYKTLKKVYYELKRDGKLDEMPRL